MYVGIPPKYSISEIMSYLKGKSTLMLFDRHQGPILNPHLKWGLLTLILTAPFCRELM